MSNAAAQAMIKAADDCAADTIINAIMSNVVRINSLTELDAAQQFHKDDPRFESLSIVNERILTLMLNVKDTVRRVRSKLTSIKDAATECGEMLNRGEVNVMWFEHHTAYLTQSLRELDTQIAQIEDNAQVRSALLKMYAAMDDMHDTCDDGGVSISGGGDNVA